MDPVSLGLCTQIDLDLEVSRASKDKVKTEAEVGATLLSPEVSTAEPEPEAPRAPQSYDADSVFAKLKQLKRDDADDEA